MPLIQQTDITLLQPDQIQSVSDAIPFFAADEYNYLNGITVIAIRLATSSSSSLAMNVEEWTTPIDGSPITIANVALSAGAENTKTAIAHAAVASGSYVFLNLDTTAANWAKVTIWYYSTDVGYPTEKQYKKDVGDIAPTEANI